MSESVSGDPHDYRVLRIHESWLAEQEVMGSKPKFWCKPDDEEGLWLFKFPQVGSGQHWAEKIAAEVAGCLGISHAVVELADCGGRQGSASKSFTEGQYQLRHGNEILARTMTYDRYKQFGQSDHTLDNVFRALEMAFVERAAAERAKREFAAYVVLDAVIGNTDRHHENWGLLVESTERGPRGFLSPTFDHASSLGRELRDEKREARLRDKTVGSYSEKGRGALFWESSGRYGPSPLELARRAAATHPNLFRPPLTKVREHRDDFPDLARHIPDAWMSSTAKDFASDLMDYNSAQLEQCLK